MSDVVGELEGEHVLVTGGTSGIGASIVEAALDYGALVSFVDIDGTGALRAEALGERCSFVEADVTDATSIAAAVAQVQGLFGPVTALANNAGRNSYGQPATLTEAEWDDFFALDLKAAWLVTRAVMQGMIDAGGGAIVNIASVHATATTAGMFPYAAAKSGILGLTRSLALELGPQQVRVNSVSPGYTRTAAIDEWLTSDGLEASVQAVHALRRIGTTREIAEVVCFLLSRRASFVTGAEWVVDGGLLARYA